MFIDTDAYERFMGRWSRRLAPEFVAFAGVRDGEHVIDVGCGTGALAETIAATFPHARVVGIDPSEAFVAAAKQRGSGRVHYEVGRAGRIEFVAREFDRVLSLLVFNFLNDPAACLDDMRRVTRPGGTIAAAVWDYGEGMQMLGAFWDEVAAVDPGAADRHERTMPFCRFGELGALWRAAGLADVEEHPLTIEQRFASFDDYWSPFSGGVGPAGAYVASLSEGERASLGERVRARLLGAGGADRAFTLEARAWAVRGREP
jgi:SAM-dependent methyltransferase